MNFFFFPKQNKTEQIQPFAFCNSAQTFLARVPTDLLERSPFKTSVEQQKVAIEDLNICANQLTLRNV